MVVGRAEPPGPLGRLYVSVTEERAAGRHAELHAWLKTEIQKGAGLSVLLRGRVPAARAEPRQPVAHARLLGLRPPGRHVA